MLYGTPFQTNTGFHLIQPREILHDNLPGFECGQIGFRACTDVEEAAAAANGNLKVRPGRACAPFFRMRYLLTGLGTLDLCAIAGTPGSENSGRLNADPDPPLP